MPNEIPFHDFGGQGPLIHLGHANSFPPGMYRKMVQPWLKDFRVIGMESRPLWENEEMKGIKSWEQMSEDLIAFLDQQGIKSCIGVGHSLGGIKMVFASLKRPDLFEKLVIIEPPFLPKWIFNLTSLFPFEWRRKMIPPARIADSRTDVWESKEDFFNYIRPKAVFKDIDDDILQDYVDFVSKEMVDGKVTLRYPKVLEAKVFAAMQSAWDKLSGIRHETLAIRGSTSDIISPSSWERWKKTQPKATFKELEGGHLIPFENPTVVASEVFEFLKS